ncbi:ectoine/hydroxyectoine ABC transporter permease subunit EhuC [Pararhizobium sp. YC-54]|uniref:ectoine/hydroxyectoine ABC transporter permease subunit EhuC n=1 Tax=Pararhizobium sp. YC-54 TaxID=2986920 RepID=UPI0021F7E8F5|nr:ectoine/hydroxyectoine ABC transporter permease subunit EhuC [Pararhizobium sp. YC-54]MCV9999363.1 ectoine/hydroxyectoine ABC transporter permease subunit EhuC [Pararhizobium sp. YC-54]
MSQLYSFLPMLLQGLVTTIQITVVAAVIATVVATVCGVIRYSGWWPLRAIVGIYIEIFRGTSCYVQLFWAFFVLPLLGVTLSPFAAAVVVIGLNVGSYGSEVVRGALKAVPRGQWEACVALNYSTWHKYRYVIVPQAMRLAIAPMANLMVDLLKITPLVSLVTISDLTYEAMVVRQQTGNSFATFLTILVVYFVLSSAIIAVFRRLEIHFSRGAETFATNKEAAAT